MYYMDCIQTAANAVGLHGMHLNIEYLGCNWNAECVENCIRFAWKVNWNIVMIKSLAVRNKNLNLNLKE